jgi:hypothetical protein
MQAWAEKMVELWRERIMRLGVIDTGQLHEKFTQAVQGNVGTDMHVIMHKFMMYGIYQDVGVGRGYTPGNGGQLHFMDPSDPDYTNKHRKPREWFSRAYYASVKVLQEQMAYMYGEEFVGLISNAIRYSDEIRGSSLRTRLWGKGAVNGPDFGYRYQEGW